MAYSYKGRAGCGTLGLPGSGTNSDIGPHAASAHNGFDYQYDATGNVRYADVAGSSSDRLYEYNAHDQLEIATVGNVQAPSAQVSFQYGPDGARWLRVDLVAAADRHTRYVGGVEIIVEGELTQIKRYIGGVALVVTRSDQPGTFEENYLFNDHLGSIEVITNATGTVLNRMSYEAFGGRRNANTWSGPPVAGSFNQSTHGYTGHEHLDSVGIIHMNGRIYDPALRRFLQADSIWDSGTQGMNRYSYVLNNPLTLTDPSGHRSQGLRTFIGIVITAVTAYISKGLGTVNGLAVVAGGGALAGYPSDRPHPVLTSPPARNCSHQS